MRFSLSVSGTFVVAALLSATNSVQSAAPRLAPELTHASQDDWVNSAPLTFAKLRGNAVLVEFWTFDCINCLHSMEWMKSIAKRKTPDGLKIVAVHTPELTYERAPENVRTAVRKLGIEYPVMLDRDFSYWNAMDNHYWPAFYLIDKNGTVRSLIVGELHLGERRTLEFEREIERALEKNSRR